MICASVYLLVFIRILLVHLVEKILLLQPLNFGGDYHRKRPQTNPDRRSATVELRQQSVIEAPLTMLSPIDFERQRKLKR
jgi:hypothetical protein